MYRKWFIRIDCYYVDNFGFGSEKIFFRVDKKELSVKMFLTNSDGSLRITDVGFVSDSFVNLEAKYSRVVKNMRLEYSLLSRNYIYSDDADLSNIFDLVKR